MSENQAHQHRAATGDHLVGVATLPASAAAASA